MAERRKYKSEEEREDIREKRKGNRLREKERKYLGKGVKGNMRKEEKEV
jgi:hypothetical protein